MFKGKNKCSHLQFCGGVLPLSLVGGPACISYGMSQAILILLLQYCPKSFLTGIGPLHKWLVHVRQSQNRCCHQSLLDFVKGSTTLLGPNKLNVLPCKSCQWSGDYGRVRDMTSIKICQFQKTLQLLNILVCTKLQYSFYLCSIRFHNLRGQHVPQVLNLLS